MMLFLGPIADGIRVKYSIGAVVGWQTQRKINRSPANEELWQSIYLMLAYWNDRDSNGPMIGCVCVLQMP